MLAVDWMFLKVHLFALCRSLFPLTLGLGTGGQGEGGLVLGAAWADRRQGSSLPASPVSASPPPPRDPRLCGLAVGWRSARLPPLQRGQLLCLLQPAQSPLPAGPGTSVSVAEIVEIAASVSSSFLSLVLDLNM